MPPSRSRRDDDDIEDRPRKRKKRHSSNAGPLLIILLAILVPALLGGGYLVYRLVKSERSESKSETAELDKYRKKLIGKWQVDAVVNGRPHTIIAEYKEDGTSSATGVLETGQRLSLTAKWQALRVEGNKLIVRSTSDRDPEASSEVTYEFPSDNEYIQSSPGGRTLNARRIK